MAEGVNQIGFRIGRETGRELVAIYEHYVKGMEWDNDTEQLLAAHLVDMYVRLKNMVRKMDKTATLTMNVSEALAFYMYWNVTDTSRWPLATVLICDMIKKIDKRAGTWSM